MFDFYEQFPDGPIKILFRILHGLGVVCTFIYDNLFLDIGKILENTLEAVNTPEWIIKIVNWLLDQPFNWFYQLSIFEIIFGLGFIFILIYGIVKFFTDLVL